MSGRFDAIVVGAGFAGVAAATSLAERGARVLVLETRQRPGGRAYSWTDPGTGEVQDNGQHVLAAFYEETRRLLRRLGTEDALQVDPTFRLEIWERGRGSFTLRCPDLPSPLHWLAAIGTCRRLGVPARLLALDLPRRVRALAARNGDGSNLTVDSWLREIGGNEDLNAILHPLALASLNESPSEGAAGLFGRVLDRIFQSPARSSGLALPGRGLGDLLAGFEEFVGARGGEVRYRATVLGVRVESGRTAGLSLLAGERLEAPCVILAVPHDRAGWMLAPEHFGAFHGITQVPWSPIVSTVHTYDRPVLASRFVGLLGTRTQWAFDRGSSPAGGHAVGTVRSAAFADEERPGAAILEETARELAEAFPAARGATLLRARVYKERRATIRATPGVQALRPPTQTAVHGLFLAGDWTDTGLPPTIEGAVQSGHRAAGLAASA
ncbi:MAG TPA: hydroxysqualene dehydroxylase HpnE [Candidatus Binatia bacterium]|nr:hydroxysqualene dehydroxylase HpnE [Candidatus Binatia bacterium]